MKVTIDPGDRDFLEQLNRMGSAAVPAICEQLKVTATAVRQRLGRLQAISLVERETIRSGRGRPHHQYRVSSTGRRQLGENYAELTRILWRAIRQISDENIREATLAEVRQSLVQSYGAGVKSSIPAERVDQLASSLKEHGLDVEVVRSGSLPILRENNCPYLELACEDASICDLEQTVFSEILGMQVSLTQCCLEGHHCCEFSGPAETAAALALPQPTALQPQGLAVE